MKFITAKAYNLPKASSTCGSFQRRLKNRRSIYSHFSNSLKSPFSKFLLLPNETV